MARLQLRLLQKYQDEVENRLVVLWNGGAKFHCPENDGYCLIEKMSETVVDIIVRAESSDKALALLDNTENTLLNVHQTLGIRYVLVRILLGKYSCFFLCKTPTCQELHQTKQFERMSRSKG